MVATGFGAALDPAHFALESTIFDAALGATLRTLLRTFAIDATF
ncbi:hypothetical protein [Sphingomicrobium sediminis]|nr:hypothetical protein [Sphingomicrobium sediminis]